MFATKNEKLDDYINELEKNCDKSAVENFFKKLMRLSPNKKYNLGIRQNHYSFMFQILPLRESLIQKDYAKFTHELVTLHHYENILQKRIYHNLIYLYKSYFEVKI